MADETKAPQIENPEKITVKDLAEMVKQMRHNQRRCQRNLRNGGFFVATRKWYPTTRPDTPQKAPFNGCASKIKPEMRYFGAIIAENKKIAENKR